ncbi:pheromone processing carboxypeptidase kex1 [Apiospora marii]|uniref:Pheromone-processing carboxypeptidase KEX1 n=1 Tax=Apiospora marii TaxID=335849 RepID=A0ABR1RU64_9PEZI
MASIASPIRLAAFGLLALASRTLTVSAEKTAADYFVHSLPGAPKDSLVKMHAGHIEVNPEHNGNLFFWHFENQHIADRQRTVIWLNGGPGCSSEDGAMMEIGPFRTKDKETLVPNNGSWHEFANLLFVDNPVGTGYSFVDTNNYLHELDEMADQFVKFLEKWFKVFPQYEHDDLYIAGESFAGQHIPYIARAILKRNKNPQIVGTPNSHTDMHSWNLKGILIGNGWVSPPEQYEAYLTYAYEKGLVKKGSDISQQLENSYRVCSREMASKHLQEVDNPMCEAVLQDILRLTEKNGRCVNMYDVRLDDTYPSCGMNWPPDLENVTPYLRRDDVTAALHIDKKLNTGWQECNGAVGAAFGVKNSKPSVTFLPELLTEIEILLFSGAEDLICNHLGTEAFISNMEWNGGKGFEISPGNWAPRRDWTFESEKAGFWQEARNLTYVLFYNSSHMVPFDYARRSRDMLDRFMDVNISSIGGIPSQSALDGATLADTTVGGASNKTADQAAKDKEVEEAKWSAYYKSGELVLVIVIVAAGAWGFFVWRSRRRTQGYEGLSGLARSTGIESFRSNGNQRSRRDVEAADFDESELDDLHVQTPTEAGVGKGHYDIDDDSDEDVVPHEKPKAPGSSSRT